FQAEDGIRDRTVTGVQTCALPIFPRAATAANAGLSRAKALLPPCQMASGPHHRSSPGWGWPTSAGGSQVWLAAQLSREPLWNSRSEERRVGKECRFRVEVGRVSGQ